MAERQKIIVQLLLTIILRPIAVRAAKNIPGRSYEALLNVTINADVVATISSGSMNARLCGAACSSRFRNCSVFSTIPPTDLDTKAKCILGKNVLRLTEGPAGSKAYIVRSKGASDPDNQFVRYNVNVRSLEEARGYCITTANGSLPVPYPQPQDLAGLKSLAQAPDHQFYVDMTMIAQIGGNLLFVTGKGEIANFRNANVDLNQFWETGEPNYTAVGAPVIMTATGWKTVPVNTSVPYVVCSKDHSPYRFNRYNGKYYKFVQNPQLSNPLAVEVCARDGGHLALPFPTNGEVLALAPYRYVKAFTGNFQWAWVAGSRAGQNGLWTFADGTALAVNKTDSRQPWAPNEPNDLYGNEYCLLAETFGSSRWIDAPCDWAASYVCELNSP